MKIVSDESCARLERCAEQILWWCSYPMPFDDYGEVGSVLPRSNRSFTGCPRFCLQPR